MSDFNQENLFDAIDREVLQLLRLYQPDEPPVEAVELIQAAFRYPVREMDPQEEAEMASRAQPQRPMRKRSREILFHSTLSVEGRNIICARAIAKELIPAILKKLGVSEGTENRSATSQLIGLITPRLLLPTRWFEREAAKRSYDLWELKDLFNTASYEMIAARLLDLEEPCIIAIVDDGEVGARKGNRMPAPKKLSPTEQKCLEKVAELGEPQTVRSDIWTVRGWPVPTGPFNRIILRSVPDEI